MPLHADASRRTLADLRPARARRHARRLRAPRHPVQRARRNIQPAALKLGHYKSARLDIAAVIDLSEKTASVAAIPPAKLRFDGEPQVWRLARQNGAGDLIDYVKPGGGVMLQSWPDGRRVIFVPDPDTGRSSPEIELARDGDADPL